MTSEKLRALVAAAYERGATIDLGEAVYGPDTGNDRGFLETMPYYRLLAGLAAHLQAATVVEVGTHYGGSTLALVAGVRSGGAADALVVTMDVTDLNRERLEAEPEIVKVVGDSMQPGFVESLAAELPTGRTVDLVYVDALKDAAFVLVTLHNLHRAGLRARYVLLDDISANDSMRALWDVLEAAAPEATYLISRDRPDIRDPRYGYAVVDLEAGFDLVGSVPDLMERLGLSTEVLDRTAPGERFARIRSGDGRPDVTPKGAPGGVRELARELAHQHAPAGGDAVVFGAADDVLKAVCDGLAARTDLAEPERRVHVFRPPEAGSNRDVLAVLGEQAALANLVSVDLNLAGWCGRPIALAVAAGLRAPRQLAHLLTAFGPSMMAGSTVLMSTDALAPYRPYQAYVLAHLAGHLEVLRAEGSALVLGYVRPIPADLILRVVEDRFTRDERVELVATLAASQSDVVARAGLLAQGVRLALKAGDAVRAGRLLADLTELGEPTRPIERKRLADLVDQVDQLRRTA